MRIGILSLVLHANYGGILQSYALQTVLERMGHDVIVMTRDGNLHINPLRLFLSWIKSIILMLLGKKVSFRNPWRQHKEKREREQYTNIFIQRYIHVFEVDRFTKGLLDGMDAAIVGSDQVWRPRYFKGQWNANMAHAFLNFQKHSDIMRIAYAVSFGTDEWEFSKRETRECSRLLKKFDAVSVRELSAIKLCKDYLGRIDVKHVLDPTLLLDKKDYICLVEQANTHMSKGDMMCYVLDMNEEKQQLISRISKERGLYPFYANSQVDNTHLPNKERIQPPLEQWLRGFIDAKFVVTDSFHACILSILFDKPFVVIANENRGVSRYESLLSCLYLSDHLIRTPSEYISQKDYCINENSKKRLDTLRQESMRFLTSALCN